MVLSVFDDFGGGRERYYGEILEGRFWRENFRGKILEGRFQRKVSGGISLTVNGLSLTISIIKYSFFEKSVSIEKSSAADSPHANI